MGLDRLMQRHSTLRFVLVMGPPVAHFGGAGRWDFPPEVLAAYKRDILLIETHRPITWGGAWEYLYPEAQNLSSACATFSAPRSCRGAPICRTTSVSAPIGNALDYVRKHCPSRTAREKDAVLGENAERLFKLRQ